MYSAQGLQGGEAEIKQLWLHFFHKTHYSTAYQMHMGHLRELFHQ